MEKSSKKRKRSENDSGKKKKIKKEEKNRKAAGLTAQAKKDKKVLILKYMKYFTARNRTRNVGGYIGGNLILMVFTSATRATAKTLTQAGHVAPTFWVLDIRT